MYMLQQLILLLLVTYASSSHYRGGSVSWDIRQSDYVNGSSTVPVRVYQRHSWRRSAALDFWATPLCTNDTINNGTALLGEASLICKSSECATSVSSSDQEVSTQVLCTDFSVEYDYASGEKYTTLQLPINKLLTYTYESCCWIDLLPGNNTPSWGLNLIIDTHRRVNGKFNNAPVSAMNPVIKVEVGQIHVINIPMGDMDGDELRCRWGTNERESGGIYEAKGVLQSSPCQLTYNATKIGYEGIAIIIEDFDSNSQILSSIPLQFLIEIVPSLPTPPPTTTIFGQTMGTDEPDITPSPPCSYIPVYIGDWGSGACIGIASNTMTEIRIVVEIPCANSSTSIRDILTISPTGVTKGPIIQDSQYNNRYIMNLQWTPQINQYGIHQLCVTPVDNSSRSGQTVCFSILVDVRSPQFVSQSMSPTGIVLQNQSTWTITTDVDIVPPTDPSISAVFFKRDISGMGRDREVIQVSMSTAYYEPRKITFNTGNITWEQDQEYYILLDAGVATINQSCGIQSSPVTDTQFWTFSIAAASTTAEVISSTTTTTTAIPEETTTTTTPEETTTTTTTEEPSATTTPEKTTATTTTEEPSTTTTPEKTTTTTIPEETTTTTIPEDTTTVGTTTTTTTTSEQPTTTTTAASTTQATASSKTTEKITTQSTTLTTPPSTNVTCPEWLLFGTIKNITTDVYQTNYSFCFYVNTTLADVTVSANTWTPCATWKSSGTADPLIDFYNITNNPTLLAQNDDGSSINELNCYAAVISYRLSRGNYRVTIRHPKCNYGRFEVRLSAEITNSLK